MRLYFDDEDEMVYLSWYEEVSKRDYWIAGIKPVAFTDDLPVIDAFEELVALSKFKFQKYQKTNSCKKSKKMR